MFHEAGHLANAAAVAAFSGLMSISSVVIRRKALMFEFIFCDKSRETLECHIMEHDRWKFLMSLILFTTHTTLNIPAINSTLEICSDSSSILGLLTGTQHFIVIAENLSLATQSGEISSLTLRRRSSSST
jgi:hypothetical protein